MVHEITQEGRKIRFDVIRSGRRKTSEITVDPTGVIVRVPLGKNIDDVKLMVGKKVDWIVNKQEEYRQITREVAKPTFEDGSRLPYRGKLIPLRVFKGQKTDAIRLVGGGFLVTLKSARRIEKDCIRRLYDNFLQEHAKRFLSQSVDEYSRTVGISPRRIIIKRMRDRWGSATEDNTLNLNVNLLKAPEEVIDYVVLHELCHLKERNHSHRFWRLLKRHMPDYREKAEWLRRNSLGLVES